MLFAFAGKRSVKKSFAMSFDFFVKVGWSFAADEFW